MWTGEIQTGNADEEEVLVDETNNADYEETVDPVSDDIASKEVFDFISGTELEPCTREKEQLIRKDIAAYTAADRSPEADVKLLDGAFAVQMLSPRTSYTFQDYSNNVILLYIFGQLQSVGRLVIVWDVCLADSLKAGTKSKRGHGQTRKVLPLAPLPSTWKSFLNKPEEKSDLFCFLSKEIERTPVSRKILVSTCGDSVVSSSTEVDLNHMSGCTHEEADTRVFLHAAEEGNNTTC